MSVCVFFGHRSCHSLDKQVLCGAIENMIDRGVDVFYVGNQGNFDGTVYSCLKALRKEYPHIQIGVVLAYLPAEKAEFEDLSDTVFPEGMEDGPPKFAIDRRNRWMCRQADYAICYVGHTWGGAYKYFAIAKRLGVEIINLHPSTTKN